MGAAVAVSLGSGGLLTASAAVNDGERSTFVPITPCRLMDTRPGSDNVGPKSSPLGPGETYSTTAVGRVGRCDIPADASAVVLNLAIVNPTGDSFLTVFPAGAPLPLAANLNFVARQAPVSNAATVDVGAGGQISFYNLRGFVDVTADVSGYYVDHAHDDRYALLDHAHGYQARTQTITLDGLGMRLQGAAQGATANGCLANFNASATFVEGFLDAPLPSGTVLHAARVRVYDQSATTQYSGRLMVRRSTSNSMDSDIIGTFAGGGRTIEIVTHEIAPAEPVTIADGESLVLELGLGPGQFGNGLCQMQLDVTMP